jgi:hypothetical protein
MLTAPARGWPAPGRASAECAPVVNPRAQAKWATPPLTAVGPTQGGSVRAGGADTLGARGSVRQGGAGTLGARGSVRQGGAGTLMRSGLPVDRPKGTALHYREGGASACVRDILPPSTRQGMHVCGPRGLDEGLKQSVPPCLSPLWARHKGAVSAKAVLTPSAQGAVSAKAVLAPLAQGAVSAKAVLAPSRARATFDRPAGPALHYREGGRERLRADILPPSTRQGCGCVGLGVPTKGSYKACDPASHRCGPRARGKQGCTEVQGRPGREA